MPDAPYSRPTAAPHPAFLPLACLLGVWLAGCNSGEIRVYDVAQSDPASQNREASSNPLENFVPDTRVDAATPSGWRDAGRDQVNVKNYLIQGESGQARVTFTPLPADQLAGREMLIMNLWRDQVGLPELSGEAIEGESKPVTIGGSSGRMVDYASTPGSGTQRRILVATTTRGNTAWYFKMVGETRTVEAEHGRFLELLAGLRFIPSGQPDTETTTGSPRWQVPSGWEETPPPAFAAAGFRVTGPEGAEAGISISFVGGTLLENVNRWRRQVGLNPVNAEGLQQISTTVKSDSGEATVVDLSGQSPQTGRLTRICVVVVPLGAQSWIYKMTGSPELVEKEKEALIRMATSAHHPNG